MGVAYPGMWAGMKMRCSSQRKKIIGSRQIEVPEASPGPNYEAFTIPTPRGFSSVEALGKNVDTSLTGQMWPDSDAEHVQDSAKCGTLLHNVVVGHTESDGASTCQHSLDGGAGSATPLEQASSTGVKQIVLRLSSLRQSPSTVREPAFINYGEPVKDIGMEIDTLDKMHRVVWSNVSDCTENKQNDQIMDCSHPDFQSSSQNTNILPTLRILHQPFQTPRERGPKEESTKAQNEDKPSSTVRVGDSGGCMDNLLPIVESRCMLDSSHGQARCGGIKHDLSAEISTDSFSHPANPSWTLNANVCKNCPVIFPRSNPTMSGCNTCAVTKFSTPCSFQRGVLRAVHYDVEPTPLNEMKPYPSRIEPPTCCQRMDFQGATQPTMYAHTTGQGMDVDPQTGRGQNLALPPQTVVEGHTCGSHYMSGDDVLVCPAPWIHEWRVFPSTPAMGVNWTPESQGENQRRHNALEESHCRKLPDPMYPSAHYSNCTSNFSADLDTDSQHYLEEHIAQEILLLSQKLADLQSGYGARNHVHNFTTPTVLSCPQTPFLSDNTKGSQKDVKNNPCAPNISQSMKNDDFVQSRPVTSSSLRILKKSDSRFEERKLGGRNIGTNKIASSTSAPSSSRGSDSDTTTTINSNKIHSHSRTESRGSGFQNGWQHGAYEVAPSQGGERVFKESVEVGKASKYSQIFSRPCRRRTREHVDEQWSNSDDIKDCLRVGGANVQRYPNENRRFDWVKTLRFGGANVCDNQWCADNLTSQMQSKDSFSPQKEFEVDPETWLRDSIEHENFTMDTKFPISASKSVQAGGTSPCAWTLVDVDDRRESESRPKRWPYNSIENRNEKGGKRIASSNDMGGLDSRIMHHLLKAGLRRAPSLWKTSNNSLPAPNNPSRLKKKSFGSRSPRRDNGKRLRRRTLSDLNLMAYPTNVMHEEKIAHKKESDSQAWQLREEDIRKCEDAQWHGGVADFEAEYEKFVESTEDVGHHDKLDLEEYTSIVSRDLPNFEKSAQTWSASTISIQGKARPLEAPVLSLVKTPPATKKTFIRCIELVVAGKKKTQPSKLNGRTSNSGGGLSYMRVDCSERPSTNGYGSLDKNCHN